MGKHKHHDKCKCRCESYPVAPYMGYNAGMMGWYGNCYAPVAGCAKGLCIENGELLIAFVLLLIFLFSRDHDHFPMPNC